MARVPVHRAGTKTVAVEHGATKGAQIGVDLYDSDGNVVTIAGLAALIAASGVSLTAAAATSDELYNTIWNRINEIPSAAYSVIGNPTGVAGTLPTSIAAAANDRVLRRVADAVDFGFLTAGMFPDSMVTVLSGTELEIETALVDLHADLDVLGAVEIQGGNALTILDAGGTDSIAFSHDSTDALAVITNGTAFALSGAAQLELRGGMDVWIRDAGFLRIYDSGDTDYGQFSHDGTDLNLTFVNTTAFNIALATEITGTLIVSSSIAAGNTIRATGVAPWLGVFESDQAADNIAWLMQSAGGVLAIGPWNDTLGATTNAIAITRSGSSVTELEINAVLLDVNAPADFSSTISATSHIRTSSAGGGVLGWTDDADTYFSNPTASNVIAVVAGGSTTGLLGQSGWTIQTVLTVSSAAPRIVVNDTSGAGVDETNWLIGGTNGILTIATATDAAPSTIVENAIRLFRSGTAVTEIQIDAPLLDFNGAADISGALAINGGVLEVFGATQANFYLIDSDGASDTKRWRWVADGGVLSLMTRTDANGAGATPMRFVRSGTAVSDIEFVSTRLLHTGARLAISTTSGPYLWLVDTDASAAAGWRFRSNSNVLTILSTNSSDTAIAQAIAITSDASTITEIQLDATTLDFNGIFDGDGSSFAADYTTITFGTAAQVELLGGTDLWIRDAGFLRIYDSGDTDYAQFSHDGTDFNTTFNATTEWNIGVSISITGSVTATGDGTFNTSDRRLKRNLIAIDHALERIRSVRGFTYEKNVDGTWEDFRRAGVIAQDVEQALPEAILEKDGYKFVSDASLSGLFGSAINELLDRVEALERRAA